ncbi:MAG: MATE family efflux transporter [Dehalococcoidales bacterium]|nr:MAG: MATE family efflux transporter [Dehalococcoidales bacterium]
MSSNTKGQQRREAMGRDPIWRLMLRFSAPAVISMTVASSYQLVDAMFVGRLGEEALAAISVTYPLALSFTAIASGTGVGITSLISRSLGAGDSKGADKVVGTAIALCFILAALIALICLPNLDWILKTLGANESVLPLARDYASIMVYSILIAYSSMIFSNIIRADGNPVFSSSVAVSSSLINIALDPVFIFGFGFVPALGIKGAAIATVIAQGVSVTVYLIYILKGRTAYNYRLSYFIPSLTIIGGIYRVGVASILRSGAQFITMGVINRTAASFGVTPLAVMGVLVRVGRFVLMPCLGLGQGMLPLIGYNFGAEKKRRISELIFKTGIVGLSWTAICWLVIQLFPEQVMSAFNVDPGFLDEGRDAIRIYGLLYILLGVQNLPGFFFQGIGRGMPASVLTLVRSMLILLPLVLILPRFFDETGIWASYPITDALSMIISVGWMIKEFRKQGIVYKWWQDETSGTLQ